MISVNFISPFRQHRTIVTAIYQVKLGFHSDAFEQLGSSFGASDRGGRGGGNTDGPPEWMQWWTVGHPTIEGTFSKTREQESQKLENNSKSKN